MILTKGLGVGGPLITDGLGKGELVEATVVESTFVGPVSELRKPVVYKITGVGNIASREAVGKPYVTEVDEELAFLLMAA